MTLRNWNRCWLHIVQTIKLCTYQSTLDVLHLLQKLSSIYGYKVNLSKSLLFPLNNLARQITYENLPFKIENNKFTYLGIVMGSTEAIFLYNYRSIYDRFKMDLDGWSEPEPFSLAGRMNAVKMTVMPSFLFLLQMIPFFSQSLILLSWIALSPRSYGIKKLHE